MTKNTIQIYALAVSSVVDFCFAGWFWSLRLKEPSQENLATTTPEARLKAIQKIVMIFVLVGLMSLAIAIWLWSRSKA